MLWQALNNFASLIWEYFIYFYKYQVPKSGFCAWSSRSELLGTKRGSKLKWLRTDGGPIEYAGVGGQRLALIKYQQGQPDPIAMALVKEGDWTT